MARRDAGLTTELDEGEQCSWRGARSPAEERRDPHVLRDRQVEKRPGRLEGPRDAQAGDPVRGGRGDLMLCHANRPLRGADEPADQIEQRGLAGAVWADQGTDLALPHPQTHPALNPQAAAALANVRAFE